MVLSLNAGWGLGGLWCVLGGCGQGWGIVVCLRDFDRRGPKVPEQRVRLLEASPRRPHLKVDTSTSKVIIGC